MAKNIPLNDKFPIVNPVPSTKKWVLIFLASCTHCPQSLHSIITASMPGLAFDINAQHDIPSKAHSSK